MLCSAAAVFAAVAALLLAVTVRPLSLDGEHGARVALAAWAVLLAVTDIVVFTELAGVCIPETAGPLSAAGRFCSGGASHEVTSSDA